MADEQLFITIQIPPKARTRFYGSPAGNNQPAAAQIAKIPRSSSSQPRFTPRFQVGRVLGEGSYGIVTICHELRSRTSPRGSPTVHPCPPAIPAQALRECTKSSKYCLACDDDRVNEIRDVGEAFACKTVERSGDGVEEWKPKVSALRREIKVMKLLGKHPNIVELKGVYDSPDRLRLVMELCDSGDLLSLLLNRPVQQHQQEEQPASKQLPKSLGSWRSLKKLSSSRFSFKNRSGRRTVELPGLPEHLAAGIFRQLLVAVEYCHSRSVIHRDIKLENVLLTSATPGSVHSATDTCPYIVKLADFGMAKILGPLTFTTGNVGSGVYKAPEVWLDNFYGTPADVYSLGVVLYALLTSKFSETDRSTGMAKHPCDWLENEFTVVSFGAKQLIAAMLTVNPNQRPSCSQLLQHPWVRQGAENGVPS